jgi:hypothetical protein
MNEYVVYHNPDVMGSSVLEVATPSIVTNKPAPADLIGSRVWLLTGEGRPRQFFIRAHFVAARIGSAHGAGYQTRVTGTNARFFAPMVELPRNADVHDFRRRQGNFAFGLQKISDPRHVRLLEEAVAAYDSRRESKKSID